MANRPPYDRDPPPPPPGGFDPRFEPRDGPDARFGGGPRYEGEQRFERGPRYDEGPNRPDPFDRRAVPPPTVGRRGMSRSTMALVGLGLLLLLGAIAFAMSLRSGPGSDRLDGNEASGKATAAADPEARCAAPATYDKIKRELFRQAATTRGTDLAAFDRLSAYAALRVTGPVLRDENEENEQVSCEGEVALDLPPGVQVVGGRRTLSASIGYTLQPAADGSGEVVTLSGAEAITTPLATLARTAAPTPPPSAPQPGAIRDDPEYNPNAIADGPPPPQAMPPVREADREPPPPAAEPPTVSTRPSFNCARARTRGEIAVCNSSSLAALDREMASFYGTAYRGADPEARALLERTRTRFLAFRDRCGNDRCIADAYRGRITEIRDIVDGRWRP